MNNNIPHPPKRKRDLTQKELTGGGLYGPLTPAPKERDLLGKMIPIDWSIFSDNPRRCVNCESWREKKSQPETSYVFMLGYKQAPAITKRCAGCDSWKKEKNIDGDFWCKHKKANKPM